MHIVVINHYSGSPHHGMQFRSYYLAREWVQRGHTVTMIAASFSHLRHTQPIVAGLVTRETIDGINYIWLGTPSYSGNGLRRGANVGLFLLLSATLSSAAALGGIPDVVIASSTYLMDVIPAELCARRHRALLIYEIHDLWPMSLMALHGFTATHPFVRLLQWAENRIYRKADRVVSLLPGALTHMQAHGLSPARFSHIPNGIDVGEWKADPSRLPPAHAALFKRLRADGKRIFLHAGSMGVANSLEPLIDSAPLLESLGVSVVLVGHGPLTNQLRMRADALPGENVHFLPSVSKACIPTVLRAADYLYIGAKRTPLYRFGVSPNKMIDYMMSGRPIVSTIDACNDMPEEGGCGFTVSPEDPDAIHQAVLHLISLHPEELRRMGESGRAYALRRHDYAVLADKFLALMH